MGIGEERREGCRFKSFSDIQYRSIAKDFQAQPHQKIKSKNGKITDKKIQTKNINA
jgi:hypothetical protein